MKIKITIPQASLVDVNSTATMMADRFNRCLNVDKSVSDGKVTYSADYIPKQLFSNDELGAMLVDEGFEFEGLILYAPVQAKAMDLEVPKYFPNSLIPEVVDEDGKVITEARRCTVSEYFPRSAKFDDNAMIELWAIHPTRLSAIPSKANMVNVDYTPSREMLGAYIQFLGGYLLDEILTIEGKSDKVNEWTSEQAI